MVNFDVLLAQNYERAINEAQNLLVQYRSGSKNDTGFKNNKHELKTGDISRETFSISHLPDVSMPRWGPFKLDHKASVGFKVIGDKILLSFFNGVIDETQALKYIELKNHTLKQINFPFKDFFDLYDLSGLETSCFSNRRFFKKIIKDSQPSLGHIAFEPSKFYFLQKPFLETIRNFKLVKTYDAAIHGANDVLKQKGLIENRPSYHVFSNKDWQLKLDGFSIRFEIINSEIIHSVPDGDLKEFHLPSLFELREKVIQTLLSQGDFKYFISDVKHFSVTNSRIRKLYVKSLQDTYEKYPFRILFYYGRNKFIQTAVNLTKPFLSFKVRACESLEHALELILKDKTRGMKTEPHGKYLPRLSAADRRTEQYVNDLLAFLGNIDWEKDGFYGVDNYSNSHPFSRVFDSIRFIKKDLDNLFEERKEAARANIAKSEFLANVSHELMTPMHGILSFSRFGIDKIGDVPIEKLHEYFLEINKCGRKLMGLLEDLLHLSKLEVGDITCQLVKSDIQKIIDSVVSDLRPAAKKKNITIMVHHPEISSEAELDYQQFSRVIEILLSNAIEYSDDGGKITIFFDHSEIKTDSGMIEVIRVHFADEGVGIPDDELTHIFDKFFQSTRTKTGAGGKGLGLAICKEIMHSHKGKIWAEHNPKGKGSVFILELPRKAVHYNI